MEPRYVICRGGAHDNDRWPLCRHVGPGHEFDWDDDDSGPTRYAVEAEIVQTNLGPMWVATPVRSATTDFGLVVDQRESTPSIA